MSPSSLAPCPPKHLGLWATLSAILGASTAYAVGLDGPTCLASGGLAAVSSRIGLIDLKLRIIHDTDTLALAMIGLLLIVWTRQDPVIDLIDTALRSVSYGLLFQTVRIIYKKTRDREGLGFGDIKLSIASAPLVNFEAFAFILLFSGLIGVLYVFIRAIYKNRVISKYIAAPFGAILISVLYVYWFLFNI